MPEVWSETVLLITFDENDGFFDHVVGAYPNVGGLAGESTVALDNELFLGKAGTPKGSNGVVGPRGLGVRVPLLVVSPWSTGGWVCSETFDHTSLIRFIEARFGVDEPNLTPWRRAVCGDRPDHGRRHPVVVDVTDAYAPDRRIKFDGTGEIAIDTGHSGGWYDPALTTPGDASFSYQPAGRSESAGRLTSDPQLGRS